METIIEQKNLIDMKDNCVHFMFAYQQKNVEQMLSYCHHDATIYFKAFGDQGKGTISKFGKDIWLALIDSFPDISNTVDAIVSENDTIKCQVLISGTQVKDFAGILNKNNHFDVDHIFIFRLNKNKKIEYIEVDWDHNELIRQLSI